jgi:hypothetical protein
MKYWVFWWLDFIKTAFELERDILFHEVREALISCRNWGLRTMRF